MNLKFYRRLRFFISSVIGNFVLKSEFGGFGTGSRLGYPCHVESPIDVFVDDNVNIRYGLGILNNKGERVEIRKYSTLAPNVTIVTNNHIPVVGVPIYLLTSSHVNDKSTSVIIEEDCWLGVGVKVLAGGRIGRGAVIGAGAVVTKAIPPYAVVVGSPAKIVGVRFSIEQIIQHEKKLYSKGDRLPRESLSNLFEEKYRELKVLGNEIQITEKEECIFNELKSKYGYVEPVIES